MKRAILTAIAVILLIGTTAGISCQLYAENIPKTSITEITAAEEGFMVKVKQAENITGYEIQYSTSSGFTEDTTKAIKTYSTYSAPENLEGNRKYYVRVRTYKTSHKSTCYSCWSSSKSVTTESKIPLDKLTATAESASLLIGDTLQIEATLDPEDTSYKELKYTSSDTEVAAVSADGLVEGIAEGNVQITVRALETDKEAVVSLKVEKPYVAPTGIKITNKSGLTVETGKTLQMTAKVLPEDATNKTVLWETSDKSKATIDSKGVLTAVRPTEFVEVTATSEDGDFTAKYTLKITKNTGYLTNYDLDKLNLSDVGNLMIVAHPDDETFWGGGHILSDRYFVVVLTNGFHSERVSDFNRVIKRYGNDKGLILSYPDTRRYLYTASGKYNGYETDKWSTCLSGMEADIKLLLNYKKWNTVVTHNPDGEYDKYHHQKVSELVTKYMRTSKNSDTDLYYFGHYYRPSEKITGEELSSDILKEKEKIIKMYLPTAQGAYDAFRHMLPYENWVLSKDW